MRFLENPFLVRLRVNHAVEHATINILAERQRRLSLVGRTTVRGFVLYGAISTLAVREAVEEGLARLRAGERDLALHPHCGTGLALAGIMAGLSALMAMGARRRLTRIPLVLLASTAAVVLAQPLSFFVQERVTTSTELAGLRLASIRLERRGGRTVHWVELAQG